MALVKDSTVLQKRFYHQTFEIRWGIYSIGFHTLLVNPEDLQIEEPSRSAVTQTLGGAFVTDFGQGLPNVTISGTTGYKTKRNTEGVLLDGYEEFEKFRREIYRQFVERNDPTLYAYWYNWEDNEYYRIQPSSFRMMRNKNEPLLYRYEFRFTCLERIQQGHRKPKDFVNGSPNPLAYQLTLQNSQSRANEAMSRM